MSQSKSRLLNLFRKKEKPKSPDVKDILGSLPSAAPKSDGPAKTTFIELEHLTASVAVPQTSGKLLEKLKTQVAQLRVIEHGSVLNTSRDHSGNEVYHPLPERIIGASIVKTDAATFLVGRTRSTWFALYDTAHETLHDRNHKLMDADLKKRDKAVTPSGKMMYLSSITTRDLNVLNTIAAMDARKAQKAAPDTLAPTEGVFSFEETQKRLQKCSLGHCTDAFFVFDPLVFTAQIRFMAPIQGDAGYYYYVQYGTLENPKECELHVGKDPKRPEGSYKHKATLFYGNEPCFFYIDVKY